MELELSKSAQKGFVLVLFLTILPVLVITLSGLAVVLLQIQAKSETRHACRQNLYQTQKNVAQNLDLLMKLNPQAELLRTELRAAEAALAAAIETPAAAAIMAEIEEIQAQKALLGAQQKSLITMSEIEMRVGSVKSDLSVRSALREKQARFSKLTELSTNDVSSSTPHLAVRPDDPSDTAPIYELESPFTDKQSLQTSWRIKYSWTSKNWIQRNLKWRQISINDSCRASIEEVNGRFRPVLNEDRF